MDHLWRTNDQGIEVTKKWSFIPKSSIPTIFTQNLRFSFSYCYNKRKRKGGKS